MMQHAAERSKRLIGWEGLAGDELVAARERGAVVTIGVFDGLHRGHLRLLAAAERLALSAGLTRVHLGFDPHPDLLLRGSTPLRLLDPIEFEMRLAGAGVEHWCDLPFDETMRDTPWEEFLERVVDLTGAKSLVLSPESAFGRNREGRLDRVRMGRRQVAAELGRHKGPRPAGALRGWRAIRDRRATRCGPRVPPAFGRATDRLTLCRC